MLVSAWAEVGLGRMSEATATLDSLSKTQGMATFGMYHKALALASAGDYEGAHAILSDPNQGALQSLRRAVLAHARILSQLERNAEALALLDASFVGEPDPELAQLRLRLAAGEPVPFDSVTSAKEGLAEVFYTVAMALGQDAASLRASAFAEVVKQKSGGVIQSVQVVDLEEPKPWAKRVFTNPAPGGRAARSLRQAWVRRTRPAG